MIRSKDSSSRLWSLLVVPALVFAGCGGDDDAGGAAGRDQGALSGNISIDGSSTVAPISEAISEEYRDEQPGVNAAVGTSGTGGGFKKFCANEIDIAGASRAIKAEEQQACAAAGVEFLELRVGLDGLAIVTSARNNFLECLSTEQLASIFKEGGATTWDQVDPKFPKEKIAIFAPGTDSGTYDFFVEEVLGDPKKPDSLKPRSDYTASEEDNVLVQGIEGEKNSWGYFGLAYFTGNKGRLKAIEVAERGGPCIEATDKTVESGDYPLSRPLFIYVKKASLARPEVKSFVTFYLETTPSLITDVGYTPAPKADYQRGLQAVDDAG